MYEFYKGFLQRRSTFCRTWQSSWTPGISSLKSHTSMLRCSEMLWITVSWSEYDHTNQWPLRRKRWELQPQFSYDKSEKQFASVAYAGMTGIKRYPSLNRKPCGSKEIWFAECDGRRALHNHLQSFFKALPFPNVFFWLFPIETDLQNIPACHNIFCTELREHWSFPPNSLCGGGICLVSVNPLTPRPQEKRSSLRV